jgi:hypothetical protein
MQEFWFKGQRKIIRRKKIKAFLWGLVIGAIIFLPCGYRWRMAQTEKNYQIEIGKLKNKIVIFQSTWTPIKEKSIMQEKREKIKK